MNSRKYYVLIDKSPVEVTEEVYHAYKRPAWRERKRREIRMKKELPLEVIADSHLNILSEQRLVDELVADKLILDELYAALAKLTDDERNLIDALFFDGKTEREYASMHKITQQTVHKKKSRILAKLKILMNFHK